MAREIITVSMDPELVKRLRAVAAASGGLPLSQIMAELCEAGMSRRGLLVFYETEEQRSREEPARIVADAIRVWGNTPTLKGWADFEWMPKELGVACKGLEGKKPATGKRGTADWIAGALKALGWTTQVVDDKSGDILEVWTHKPGDKCAECPKMARITEAMNAEH